MSALHEEKLTKPIRINKKERTGQQSVQGIRSRLKLLLLGSVFPVVLVILWELLSRYGILQEHLLPSPTGIVHTVLEMGREGTLWAHMGITLYRVVVGFSLGTVAGVLIGTVVGIRRTAEQLFDPLIQAFRSIPSIAWVPLFILWMGIGESSKITLIAVGVFFPVYLNIVSGIRGVDRKLIEVGHIYHLTPLEQIRRIILPASLPSFLVGIRSGLGLGWMFVVAAELMGASQGLGYLLVFGQNTYSPQLIIASIVLFAVLGKLTDAVLKYIELKLLHWRDTITDGR